MDQHNQSFLKFVGSFKYNTTEAGKITLKRYYISQRITYKWIDSLLSCKAVGMQLAYMQTREEVANLAAIAWTNPTSFDTRVFIDGDNLIDTTWQATRTCYSFQTYSRREPKIRSENCNKESLKFLCENMEVVDNYDDPFLNSDSAETSEDSVDVRAKYFTYLGDVDTKKKSYYASFNVRATPIEALKICESLDMRLASPQSQSEYDNMVNLLKKFASNWKNVMIDGYRSEENGIDWVTFNNKIKYTIDWNSNEPNNYGNNENCLAMVNVGGQAKMNDISCSGSDFRHQFICEYDESVTYNRTYSETERSTLLMPLTSYNIGSLTKELFLSEYEMTWYSAIITCKVFGMQLLPVSLEEDEMFLTNKFENLDLPSTLHVGATSMGTDDVWYSIHTGKVLNFNFDWNSDGQKKKKCLRLRRDFKAFHFDTVNCVDSSSRFICQKISEDLNNAISTAVPSWIRSVSQNLFNNLGSNDISHNNVKSSIVALHISDKK